MKQHTGEFRNTFQEVGVYVLKSTIKIRLHLSKYRGFNIRYKPLISLKNRKTKLEFAKNIYKKIPYSSGPTSR